MDASDGTIQKTPLFQWHKDHGARMVDFAGWAMPIQYSSIIEEHERTRITGGIADISHMGRLRFEGPGAAVFLAELLTRRVADMTLGQIRYSLVTNDAGGIMDEFLSKHNRHYLVGHQPQPKPTGDKPKQLVFSALLWVFCLRGGFYQGQGFQQMRLPDGDPLPNEPAG